MNESQKSQNINFIVFFFSDVTGIEMPDKKINLTLGVWVKDLSESLGKLIGQVCYWNYNFYLNLLCSYFIYIFFIS